MYPDLSYFVYELTGWGPDNGFAVIKTFGLFLALAVIAAAYVLRSEFYRKEAQGILKPRIEEVVISEPIKIQEVVINALIGFIIGYKGLYAYHHFDTFRTDPAGVIFSGLGDAGGGMIGLIVFGGYTLYKYVQNKDVPLKKKKQEIFPHDRVSDIAIQAAIWGVIGSKLFSILENFTPS